MPPVSLLPDTLVPGAIVAQRFTLQRLAGRGGMGLVFQARDEQTGQSVALKLLHAPGNAEVTRRFAREAQLLASLRHPGIVSYVAHGLTEEEQPFLAMEWLEGEDLARRLARDPLSLSESLQVLRRAASALAAAHAQGIIHRDLKPSNLFLRAGQPGDVVVLDFGLAHVHAASQALTGSAMVLGTPGYMAPEQASNLHELSPGADIFSLGCVLYECLAGQAPFRAPHMAAVLAKILFSEPTPLRTLRPELPASLQHLVERMLAKEPRQRPPDAGHLLHALEGLEALFELPPPPRTTTVVALPEPAHAEQYLVSLLLATPRSSLGEVPTLGLAEVAEARKHLQPLVQDLQAHSAHAVLLADGSLLATFVLERGTANDQATLAAHCALSVKERWPDSVVALTTGLSLRGRPLPVGDAVDRAGELLQKARRLAATSQVLVDDTTAGLLGSRFQLEKTPSSLFLLSAEHLSVDESRPLLGRPTPCVGREQELALLELAFASCVEDSSARALLVTAPAGAGKSRLRHELLRRLERHARPPLVLLGRGDPMSTSTAHGLVGQAVRRLCGVVDGEPLEARRARLTQRLTRHLPPELHQETTEFLGELCATPFPEGASTKLRAAREDPRLMSAQVTRALVIWLEAECARSPVLLMLEDLHWSDGSSVKLVEEVLRELSEQPLLVLALARPEVKELFPGLWGRSVQEVPLRGLSQKASTRLVREVLGPQVPEAVVARLVGQAAGNALFLEELIRGVAEGPSEETPGSVLAMLQSRLQRLAPEARRVVLAASIFGRTFWAGGVLALLEPALSSEELTQWLRRLVELEVVQPQPESRFPTEAEYRFHHALVRDAAYSLVPDALRATGHLQAGEWLEAAGESEPLVLAEHYKLGGQRLKAIAFFTQACKQSCELQRTDLQGALRCLKAALDCEPTGQALTELQVLEADISFWMDDVARNIAVSEAVLPQLVEGSTSWIQVVGNLIMMNAKSGRPQEVVALSQRLLGIEPAPEAIAAYSEALAFVGVMYQWTGNRDGALIVLERLGQVARGGQALDPFAHGWWCANRASFECELAASPWGCRRVAEEGMEAFGEVGAVRNQLVVLTVLGQALASLGELPRGVEVMKEGLARARYFDQAGAWLQVHMSLVLSSSPAPEHHEEARRLALHLREVERTNPMHVGIATVTLARVALARGAPTEAEAWAREACELLGPFLPYQVITRTSLSAALLSQGRAPEARAEAEQGVRVLERLGGAGSASVGAWLTLAEACQAAGDDAAAEGALRQALECLRLRVRDLPDAAARARFLGEVPVNARALHRARERWGEAMGGLAP
jgi:serine/threonine protein kinase/tetratricopeptide (TPR) repeat protein